MWEELALTTCCTTCTMALMGWLEGTYQHMRRADMHMKVALTVMNQFGHVDSLDKRCSQADAMVFLGVTIDVTTEVMLSLIHI